MQSCWWLIEWTPTLNEANQQWQCIRNHWWDRATRSAIASLLQSMHGPVALDIKDRYEWLCSYEMSISCIWDKLTHLIDMRKCGSISFNLSMIEWEDDEFKVEKGSIANCLSCWWSSWWIISATPLFIVRWGWVRIFEYKNSKIRQPYTCSLMNTSTWICLNKYERLAKKDHKSGAGLETVPSYNRSNTLVIKLSDFLSFFPATREKEEDNSIALLLLALVQFPIQNKIILSLGICLADDSFSCAYRYSSHWWSITLSQ